MDSAKAKQSQQRMPRRTGKHANAKSPTSFNPTSTNTLADYDDFPSEELIRHACRVFEPALARLARQCPAVMRIEDYRLLAKIYLSAVSYRYVKHKGKVQPFLFEKTHPPEYFLTRMHSAIDHFKNDFELYESLVDFESLRLDDATIENLEAAGINSVDDICSLTEHELGSIDQISESKVEQIKIALAVFGRKLKPKKQPRMLFDSARIDRARTWNEHGASQKDSNKTKQGDAGKCGQQQGQQCGQRYSQQNGQQQGQSFLF